MNTWTRITTIRIASVEAQVKLKKIKTSKTTSTTNALRASVISQTVKWTHGHEGVKPRWRSPSLWLWPNSSKDSNYSWIHSPTKMHHYKLTKPTIQWINQTYIKTIWIKLISIQTSMLVLTMAKISCNNKINSNTALALFRQVFWTANLRKITTSKCNRK